MAAREVFKRTGLKFGGAFSADRGVITSLGRTLNGVLMQSMNISYSQNVQRIFELGASNNGAPYTYYAGGRASGQMGVGHILGPRMSFKAYYRAYSDVCIAGYNRIMIHTNTTECDPVNAINAAFNDGDITGQESIDMIDEAVKQPASEAVKLQAVGCVLTNIAISVNAEQLLFSEQSQLTFFNLRME